MNNEDTILRGFRKITDSKDGGLGEVTNDWPGICAMLLRKIIRDMYIGKGKEGFMQWQDENITYPQMEELIEEFVKRYYGSSISDAELKSEKSRLLTEFSRDGISFKVLGELLLVLDFDWVDISITAARKSGTVKTYMQHIGGIGKTQFEHPEYTEEFNRESGGHDNPSDCPDSLVVKKIKKNATRNKRSK